MGELNSTVIGGVLIFVLGQLIIRFVLDPLHEWRKLRGDIAHALHFYANVYVADGMHSQEYGEGAREHYRNLASQVWQRAYAIPFYRIFALLRIVPKWSDVRVAAQSLTGLSNTVFHPETRDRTGTETKIRKALRLRD